MPPSADTPQPPGPAGPASKSEPSSGSPGATMSRTLDSEDNEVEDTLPAADGTGARGGRGSIAALDRGSKVGRYTVLDRIGAGGMGVVYAAFDPQLDRRIALKVMHPGAHGSLGGSDGKSRLLREAQSMAKLSHPNVITVHDVGTFGERVFVAMEFIEGNTLREWLRPGDREWAEVIDAFVRAGRGLASAHAAGLVHRDFKPDNVLMGYDGRVLVMDFGLARQAGPRTAAQDPETTGASPTTKPLSGPDLILTRTGALLGTPAYMAPEQHASGHIGPHADQFSFCIALYEGLYGERPFAGTSVTSLAMNVLEGQVRPPPRDARVPGWLRTVVLRGLSREPDDRFPSMDALLAELQRDPPQARRPWVAVGVALGVGGVITAAYLLTRPDPDKECRDADKQLVGTWDENRAQAVQAAITGTQLPYADAAWQSVATVLEDYEEDWISAYEQRCRADAIARRRDPNRRPDPGLVCLDDHRVELDALVSRLETADDTTVTHAVAAAQRLDPVDVCATGDELRSPAPGGSAGTRFMEARAGLAEAKAMHNTGRPRQALERAIPLVTMAGSIDAPALEAEVLLLVAEAQDASQEPRAAEESLRRAILAAAAAQRHEVEARGWAQMVRVVGLSIQHPDEGRRLALAAEAAIRRAGDDPRLRAHVLMSLGAMEQLAGRYDEAADRFERALEIREEHLDPDNLGIAEAREGIGCAHEAQGRFKDAIEAQNTVLAMREQVLGARHPWVARSLVRLGAAMQGDGRIRAADASLIRARMNLDPNAEIDVDDLPEPSGSAPTEPAGNTTAPGRDQIELAYALDQLGLLRRAQQEFTEAARLHNRAAALLERVRGPHHRDVAYPIENLGLSLADLGRHKEAMPHLRRALKIWQDKLEKEHPDLGTAHLNLANSMFALGKIDEAGEHYGHALNIWEDRLPSDHPLLSYALTGLGRTKLDSGEAVAALDLLERALEIRTHAEEDQLNAAETSLLLARALWASGRGGPRAIELTIRARDITGADEPTDLAGLRRVLTGGEVPRFTDQLFPAGLGANHPAFSID